MYSLGILNTDFAIIRYTIRDLIEWIFVSLCIIIAVPIIVLTLLIVVTFKKYIIGWFLTGIPAKIKMFLINTIT